ncbi:MAG TPA: tetratricopeptide repeat protein [Calditrichaeota bacterium]|nr:tetratricopeptide repeat protein [Calditrichota bacterium]
MKNIKMLMKKAQDFYVQKEYDKAAKAFLEVLKKVKKDKERAIIWAELSWTFYRLKDYRRVLDAITNVFHFDEDYDNKADLFRLKGYALLALNELDEAENALHVSLTMDRDSPKQQTIFYELGKLYFRKQEYKQALQAFNEVESYFLQNHKEFWLSILFYKGMVHYYTGNIEDSEATFEELLENANDNQRKAAALFGLAFITFDRKDYLKTINLCESITSLDSSFFDLETVGFLSAASFHYLGRDDVFEKYYYELIKNYPRGRYSGDLHAIKKKIDESRKGSAQSKTGI